MPGSISRMKHNRRTLMPKGSIGGKPVPRTNGSGKIERPITEAQFQRRIGKALAISSAPWSTQIKLGELARAEISSGELKKMRGISPALIEAMQKYERAHAQA